MSEIQVRERIDILDILRGWALLGVVLMNYYSFYFNGIAFEDFKKLPTDPVNDWLAFVANAIFSGKSWRLLCFLFGYGFALLLDKLERMEQDGVSYFSQRMLWLLTFSIVNTAIFSGDILKDYAVMGLLLLCFRKASARTLVLSAMILALLLPVIQFGVNKLPNTRAEVSALSPLYRSHNILDVFEYGVKANFWSEVVSYPYLITVHLGQLVCFLLGLAAQKIHFFERLRDNKKYLRKVFWLSLTVGLPIFIITQLNRKLKWELFKYYGPQHIYFICFIFFVISGFSLLYLRGKMKGFLNSLRMAGRLTLTNYIVQNVLSVVFFSGVGLGLVNKLYPGWYLFIGLVVFFAQVLFSKWWLQRHRYGPVEWLWRRLCESKSKSLRAPATTSEAIVSSNNKAS